MTCQKFLLRKEPVSLVRKPEKVSKIRKHPVKGLSVLATILQKIQKAQMALKPSLTPLNIELLARCYHVLCPRVDMESCENSPQWFSFSGP